MKLALIDLSNIFWQCWHATAGQDVDASYRVSLERVTSIREGYDAVCVCCDIGKTWRHDVFPQYKGNRPPRDAAAYDQLRRVREQLEADGVPVVSFETYEADDIIATLACKAPANGYDVEIHSGDKDLCQLVGPSITVISTNNGSTRYDEDKVREKFRVNPSQLGDFLALVGDKSDNIAGCPGCGEVNAARLLTELGSLANMLEMPDAITPPKMRENIVANKQAILLARRLVSLRTDVPLDFAECTTPREPKAVQKTEPVPEADDEAPKRSPSTPPASNEERAIVLSQPATAPMPRAELVFDKSDPRWMLSLEPQGLKQLWWFAEQIHASGLYRKFGNAQAVMAAMLKGRSLGLDMMTSLDVINVIKGKPSLGAMAIVGRVLASGKAEYFEPVESTDVQCTWRTKRQGRPERTHTYSMDDARKAGLDKPSEKGEPSNYVKRPKPMLLKQCGVELARMVYPDIVANLYDDDELRAS